MRLISFVALLAVIIAAVFFMQHRKSTFISNQQVHSTSTAEQQIIYTPASAETLVRNISVRPGSTVTSPLTITGEARGQWYFEATFLINITDGDGLIIGTGSAHAQSDWMTTEFVPFEATIDFTIPANAAAFGNRGTVILKKDNPSGLPERDATVEIPIRFN